MEFSAAATAIRTRFETQWAVSNSSVPVFWENENNRLPETEAPFVHIQIRLGASRIVTLGGESNNVHRQFGEVIIRLFEVSQYGMDRIRGLADDAAEIFRSYATTPLRFFASAPTGGVEELDGNYAIVTVIASFQYDLIG
jgi:hypothetical protein